jgi:GntR family transcriptional regulator, histidine utilization repressor
MQRAAAAGLPLYQKVKAHVLERMASGELVANSRVPSEHELVRELGVSRMTVNRALNDLSQEGVLVRLAGVGTFVAERAPHAHPLQILNIADEIRQRGHEYRATVVSREAVVADSQLARDFNLPIRARLFHTIVVHHENDVPIQVEDRYVNPAIAPHYLDVDFTEHTPNEYLISIAPIQRAEHVLRAALPDAKVADLLDMDVTQPCLLLLRRTWTNDAVASTANLYYPGSRYEFAGDATA